MTLTGTSIFDPKQVRQDVGAKLSKLSQRNARLWLSEQIRLMTTSRAMVDRYRGIICSLKLYTLFPSNKLVTDRATLTKALKACNGLIVSTTELQDLPYTLLIHLGNLHVAHNLFFEALEYFQDAAGYASTPENHLVCLLNQIRCKLWLRDFRDVATLMRGIGSADRQNPDYSAIILAVDIRLKLLLGDVSGVADTFKTQAPTEPTIELTYLSLIHSLMNDWETSIQRKYEKFISATTLNQSSARFYQFESTILDVLQDLKRGRAISTTTQRKLASLKQNVDDFHLQECAKALLVFIKNQNSTIGRKLSLLPRMTSALHQLLYGANDFMYQFASILWLDYLWNKNQKTEFARYFIEFKSYAEKLKFELATSPSHDFWLLQQISVFDARYHHLHSAKETTNTVRGNRADH